MRAFTYQVEISISIDPAIALIIAQMAPVQLEIIWLFVQILLGKKVWATIVIKIHLPHCNLGSTKSVETA